MAILCSTSTHTVVLSNSRTELHGQIDRIWVTDICAEIMISIWWFCSLSNWLWSCFFIYFILKKKINTIITATTTTKQNKLKVLCFLHSLPVIYSSWNIILVLFQEQARIEKLARMKTVILKIWEKLE